jgi:hypothetical protein
MAAIPAKVVERIKTSLARMQKILEQAKMKDINEADTVVIVSDVLTEVFGYDKYNEITREYAIKGTYCDLAIKTEGTLKFLIEVKAIGITLAEKHYQQALDYGANNGTEWIVLTNGVNWKVYKVKFEKPISATMVCEFNLLELKIKNQNDLEKLYILCKEGLKKNAIDEFTQHKMIVNKYYISAILQNESVIEAVKKELRKIDPAMRVESEEVQEIIVNDVLKREVIDSPDAVECKDKFEKVIKKIEKKKSKEKDEKKKEDMAPEQGETSDSAPENVAPAE